MTVCPVVIHSTVQSLFFSRRAAWHLGQRRDGPASLRLGAMGCSSSRAKGDASPAGSSSGSKETSAASATASSGVARRDDDAASQTSRVPIPTRWPDSAPAGRPARDRPSSALAATYPIPTPASTSPRVPANPAPAPRESDDGEKERWPPRSSRDPSETAFSDIASASIGAENANDASAEDASAASSKRARPSRASAVYAELSMDAVASARAETVDRSDDERARSAARVEGAPHRDGEEDRQDRRSGGQAQDSDAARGRGAESDVRRATRVVAKAVAAVRAATAKDARRVHVADARDDAKHGDGASGVGASEGENEDDGNGDGDDEDGDEKSRGARFVPGVGVTSARRAAAARAARRAMERARDGRGHAQPGRGRN